jgi:hypothetical protein
VIWATPSSGSQARKLTCGARVEHSPSALDAYGVSLNFEDRIASFDLELIERIRVELDVPEDEWMEYLKML